MGKRGQKKHMKRIAVPPSVGISNKKEHVWMTKAQSGPHDRGGSVPLGVVLIELLKLAKTRREVKNILSRRMVSVDGRVRTQEKFPVGLMDVISLNKEGKYYRVIIGKHGRLILVEIKKDDAKDKIAKVTKKFTQRKGELRVSLHDGKTIKADNNVKVGDSVIVAVPENKIKKILKIEKGARCLIKGGKHSGTVAAIEEILKGGEARIKEGKHSFITTLTHICIVDERIKGAK